jgi:hypothetical protein
MSSRYYIVPRRSKVSTSISSGILSSAPTFVWAVRTFHCDRSTMLNSLHSIILIFELLLWRQKPNYNRYVQYEASGWITLEYTRRSQQPCWKTCVLFWLLRHWTFVRDFHFPSLLVCTGLLTGITILQRIIPKASAATWYTGLRSLGILRGVAW